MSKNLHPNFFLKWFKLEGGFTLTEILISIAIIALVVGVAVPNYRRSQQNQEFLTSVSNLKNDLKQVQNSYVSSIHCNKNSATMAWVLRFTTGTPSTYSPICLYPSLTPINPAICQYTAVQPVTTPAKAMDTKVEVVGLVRGSSATVCSSPVSFCYDQSGFGYQCAGDAAVTRNDSFTIQLRNSANTSLTRNLTILPTGTVQEN